MGEFQAESIWTGVVMKTPAGRVSRVNGEESMVNVGTECKLSIPLNEDFLGR